MKERGVTIREFEENLPREVFREIRMPGKGYWAHTRLPAKYRSKGY